MRAPAAGRGSRSRIRGRYLMTSAAEPAHHPTRQVATNELVKIGARIGLIAHGVTHLLIAWMALQVALGDRGPQANQSGAFQELAHSRSRGCCCGRSCSCSGSRPSRGGASPGHLRLRLRESPGHDVAQTCAQHAQVGGVRSAGRAGRRRRRDREWCQQRADRGCTRAARWPTDRRRGRDRHPHRRAGDDLEPAVVGSPLVAEGGLLRHLVDFSEQQAVETSPVTVSSSIERSPEIRK